MFCLPLLTSIPFKLVKAILFLFLIPISLANIHHANKSALNILKVLRVTTSSTITIQLSVTWMPKIKHKQSDIISRTEVLFLYNVKDYYIAGWRQQRDHVEVPKVIGEHAHRRKPSWKFWRVTKKAIFGQFAKGMEWKNDQNWPIFGMNFKVFKLYEKRA